MWNDKRLTTSPSTGRRPGRLASPPQQVVIDYLIEENRVLKEQLERRRFRFTDEQRMRLAAKARVLGRQSLDELATLVTPDTPRVWLCSAIVQAAVDTKHIHGVTPKTG